MEQFYFILKTFKYCDHISKASNTSSYMKKKIAVVVEKKWNENLVEKIYGFVKVFDELGMNHQESDLNL